MTTNTQFLNKCNDQNNRYLFHLLHEYDTLQNYICELLLLSLHKPKLRFTIDEEYKKLEEINKKIKRNKNINKNYISHTYELIKSINI